MMASPKQRHRNTDTTTIPSNLTKANLSIHTAATKQTHTLLSPSNNYILSPAADSTTSQGTALSRARSEIEGRRKSRAAARARASAALEEITARDKLEPNDNEDVTENHDDEKKEVEEDRQPREVEEDGEEEDRVGQIIATKSYDGGGSPRRKRDKKRGNMKKKRDKSGNDRPNRGNESMQHVVTKNNDPSPAFVLTEEYLMAVSQAAFDAVSPKLDPPEELNEIPAPDKQFDTNTGRVEAAAAPDVQGTVLPDADIPTLSEADMYAVSQAALDASAKMDFFEQQQQEEEDGDTFEEVELTDKYDVDNHRKALELNTTDSINKPPTTVNEESSISSNNISMKKKKSTSSTTASSIVTDGSRMMMDHNSIVTVKRETRSTTTTNNTEVEKRPTFAQPTPRMSNSSPVTTPPLAVSPSEAINREDAAITAITEVDNQETHHQDTKSEDSSHNHSVSTGSSSWDNEQPTVTTANEEEEEEEEKEEEDIDVEVDQEMGVLDSMMFQKKGLGQLRGAGTTTTTTNSTLYVETGLSNNASEYSGHSSYSSDVGDDDDDDDMIQESSTMGPVWQKAIDDAQHKLYDKEKKKKGEGLSSKKEVIDDGDEETEIDEETILTARPGYNLERMQYVASYGVLFLLMNSLFVVLDGSTFAIRIFGLVGLISATFPLIVIGMFLMSSTTQRSFWLCSIKILLVGCLVQVCMLILFICLEIGAGAGAVGFVSLASLLALTVEMNTNSPVPIQPNSKGEKSNMIIGGMMKCLGLFGLTSVDEHEDTRRRKRRKNKSRLLDRTLDEDDDRKHSKKERSSTYLPPDIA